MIRPIASVLLVLAASAAYARDLPKATGERWIEARSPHFTLFSSAGEADTRALAADLEALRATLGQVTGLRLVSPLPTWIYLFRNDRQYRPYQHLYDGQPADVGGTFFGRPYGDYLTLNVASGHGARPLVLHEYVHSVTDANLGAVPLWLDEGLAEYFSTFRLARGHAEIGRLIPLHVHWLRRNALIPFPDLFAVDADSETYNESDRRGVFYAQSWAVVHYLMNGGDEQRRRLGRFFDLLAAEAPPLDAFRRAVAPDFAAFEKELRTYLAQRRFTFRRLEVGAVEPSAVRIEAMGRVDVLYRLGDLLAIQGDRGAEAEAHFRAALDLDPNHGRAVSGLGYLAQLRDDWPAARQHYTRAAELAGDDFLVQHRLGRSLLETRGDSRRARRALARAVELNPEFGQAWAQLARSYLTETAMPEAAVEVGETAHRLLPHRVDAAFSLLRIYAAAGRGDDARRLLDGFFRRRASPADLGRARQVVLRAEVHRLGELARRGEHAEALALLEGLEAGTPGSLGEPGPDLRRQIAHHAFDVRYQHALGLYGDGQLEEAQERLEALVAATDDDAKKRRAEGLLRLVRLGLDRR